MPDKVTYYAVVNDLSSRDRPAGLFRRTYTEAGGLRDEAFTRDLVWKNSSSLFSAERGGCFIPCIGDPAASCHEIYCRSFQVDGSVRRNTKGNAFRVPL